jgi:APA family basic amino acid/polyamine antiporter
VIVLRKTRPALPRAFRVPLVPLIPILGMAFCGWLMISLPMATWIAFVVWMSLGLVLYFTYSQSHSTLAAQAAK